LAGLFTIAKKEFYDIITDKKFLLIFGTLLLVVLVSTYEGGLNYRSNQSTETQLPSLGGGTNGGRTFAFGGAGTLSVALESLTSNFSLVGGVLALAISYSMINSERQRGSIKTMLSYPIYRDQIVYGKYLGGLTIVSIVTVLSFITAIGVFIGVTGIAITMDIAIRFGLYLLFSFIYMAIFLAIGLILSVVFIETSTSLLASIIVWLASIYLIPNLCSAIGQIIFPRTITITSGRPSISTPPGFDIIRSAVSALSPSTTYENLVQNVLTSSQLQFNSGQVTSISISLGQALTTSLPSIIYFIGILIALFAAAYFVFTRQEIR
jgi:ABC-2 type transport system permease protein